MPISNINSDTIRQKLFEYFMYLIAIAHIYLSYIT